MLARVTRLSFLLLACSLSCATPPRFQPPPPAAPVVLEPEPVPEPVASADPASSAEAPIDRSSTSVIVTDRPRVGVIHSLSGTLYRVETPLKNTVLMAIEEINRMGGVLGRTLEPVVVDPASNWPLFAEKAREVVQKEQANVVFGGHTSVSRKSMLPVFEELGALYFYPAQHEGEETSGSTFYTGSIPNQSVSVVADYLAHRPGRPIRRWFVIGTDYVVPRVQAKLLTEAWTKAGVPEDQIEVAFTPFGHADYQELVARLRRLARGGPTAVISLLYRESALRFQDELVAQKVSPKTTPVVAFGLDERDVAKEGRVFAGTLLARSYFSVIDTPKNVAFKRLCADYAANHHFGTDLFTVNDDVEATYVGVQLWKQAVESTKSFEPTRVAAALAGQTFEAPSGFTVRIDPANHHLHKPYFVAEVARSGGVKIVWKTPAVVAPIAPAVR
jgi:urea transport system substrate-binding protein